MCVERNSNLCPFEQQLCDDIETGFEIDLSDTEYGKSESIIFDKSHDEVSFEQDSSTLCSSLKSGCLLALDSSTNSVWFECGNQTKTVLGVETEGKANCTELQYGTASVETKEDNSLGFHSEILFSKESFCNQFEISDKTSDNSSSSELLLLSKQSNAVFETTLPEPVEKNFDSLYICSREKGYDDFGLQNSEIILIRQNPRMHMKPLVHELPRPPDQKKNVNMANRKNVDM